MSTHRYSLYSLGGLALATSLLAGPAHADQLVYVPLAQPCRLLDTRGVAPLTAAHGAYLFGTSPIDITAQHGNSAGCGIPVGIEAVSVNMNLLNASAAGNIATWSAQHLGSTAPNIGTAVYNPTVSTPAAGQVQYNTGYTTVPVGAPTSSAPGSFYLQVANGQIDMTINVVGYWLPLSWDEDRSGVGAVTLGVNTTASGNWSTAMGVATTASGESATAMGANTLASKYGSFAAGYGTKATGMHAVAMGADTEASGEASIAIGKSNLATGPHSVALGTLTTADGLNSVAMGSSVSTNGYNGSFIFGDSSSRSQVVNTNDNQFVVAATGGAYFFTSCGTSCTVGAGLLPGSGTWTTLSDRNAKTAVQPVDGREVLKKVAALPLNTWQYKTQDAQYRHMGPMAQDFYAAFKLGETDKGIDTVDADGVALAAIQGLYVELAEKDREIATLHAEAAAQASDKDAQIAALRSDLARQAKSAQAEMASLYTELSVQKAEATAQKKRVAAIEPLAAELADLKAQLVALRTPAAKSVMVAYAQP